MEKLLIPFSWDEVRRGDRIVEVDIFGHISFSFSTVIIKVKKDGKTYIKLWYGNILSSDDSRVVEKLYIDRRPLRKRLYDFIKIYATTRYY